MAGLDRASGFSLKGMVQSASASSVRRPPRTGSLSSLRIRVTSAINIEDVPEENDCTGVRVRAHARRRG
jgi:hypothetical protein